MTRKLQYPSISRTLFVPAAAVAVFSSFSQPSPVRQVAHLAPSVAFAPVQAPFSPVFSAFSQPLGPRVNLPDEQPSALFEITPPPIAPSIFALFSQPQANRGNLPDEQPSTLFEVAPPPIVYGVFTPFSVPQPSRGTLSDEQPSTLFEVLPPAPAPFTGFAQFQPVIRVKPMVALFVPASGWIPPPIPPEPPPAPYVPHGGGFGGGWNYSDGWGYNSNKRIRKPGEPPEEVQPDDIRELILDAIGRPKPKRVVIPPPVLLPPDPVAMQALAQWLMQAEQARIMDTERRHAELADEDDIEVLMLGMT